MDPKFQRHLDNYLAIKSLQQSEIKQLAEDFTETSDKITDEIIPLLRSYETICSSNSGDTAEAVRLLSSVIQNSCNQINASTSWALFRSYLYHQCQVLFGNNSRQSRVYLNELGSDDIDEFKSYLQCEDCDLLQIFNSGPAFYRLIRFIYFRTNAL